MYKDNHWTVKECTCGQKFIPTPNYLYKIKGKKDKKTTDYYCSYTCWRKAGGGNGKGNIHGI